MRRGLCILVLPLMMLAVFYSCTSLERPVQVPALRNMVVGVRYVHVLVGMSTKTEPLTISASRPATIYAGDTKLLRTVPLAGAKVASVKGAVVVGDFASGLPALLIVPDTGDYISVGKTMYPGLVALISKGDAVQAINYVKMEDYVAGVASCEMPSNFDIAAIEAQAVAARTYALFTMGTMRLMPYDLKDSQASQVYQGLTGTSSAGRRAAQKTSGVVMLFGSDWQFLPAYYCSTCGGHTAPASQMAGAPDIAPLCGVECGFCGASSRYRWTTSIPAAEMEKSLSAAGYVTGQLTDIQVSKTSPGGWVEAVDITSAGGTKRLTGYAFRQVVGAPKLLSTDFTVAQSGDSYVIDGKGWGHGVGMCQFGADGMGREGYNYAKILQHYYPGIKLVKIY
jgi:stage II sporulation protein D